MPRNAMRFLFPILVGAMVYNAVQSTQAEEPLVFRR